ncbi:ATP-dependent DNA helicase [Paenibacillus sp. YIM B09110]|uniref:ATP-dependent DNA helicase n=1 Tax=Paenibacillus sp. YIM B09110 TaxID=3126102 RepID=UPI00301D37B3
MSMRIADFFDRAALTGSQAEAIARLESFINGSNQAFVLKGYAGTGKTFMLSRLCEYFNAVDQPFRYIAPTGRAAKVLRKKTNQPASTIHSLVYQLDPKHSVLELEEEQYKLLFRLRNNEDSINTVYIVDESSMVSDTYSDNEHLKFGSGKLLSDFLAYAALDRSRRKVIFIGDYAQLPPVNSRMSPALSIDYLADKHALACEHFELSDVYRQAQDSGILQASMRIRGELESASYSALTIQSNEKDIHEIPIERSVDVFSSRWSPADEESIILIAQTNDAVYKYNRAIRRRLGMNPSDIVQGDQLLVVKNTMVDGVPLFNGDFINVVRVSPNPEIRRIRLKGEEEEVKLSFRTVIVSLTGLNGEPLQVKTKVYENLLYSGEREIPQLEQRALMADFRMRNPHLKQKQEMFSEMLRSDPYFNALQVKYGYAITGHKSQGGEWKSVIVDYRFTSSTRSEQYFRWAYTATTRAKSSLYTIYPPAIEPLEDIRFDSDAVGQLAEGVADKLRRYNLLPSDIEYKPYQFIWHVRTENAEQRISVHYNAKLAISSYQLLDGVRNLDDRIMKLIMDTFVTSESSDSSSGGDSSPSSMVHAVKEAVVPLLVDAVADYELIAVTEHPHVVKIRGLALGEELVLNVYFNKNNVFTKLIVEKGIQTLSEQVLLLVRQKLQAVKIGQSVR